VSAVARRYAKALFELARQGGDFESVGRDLAQVADAFDVEPLKRFAENTTLDEIGRAHV